MKTPEYIKRYFWEGELQNFESDEFPHIISRILDLGNTQAISWLFNSFPKETIVRTLIESREISRKSANYWSYYFKVPREQVKCLQNPLTAKLEKIWPY